MKYRAPNIDELFPLTYKKQLLNIQSTQFINNSLSKGGVTKGLEGLPTSIPSPDTLDKEIIKTKIAKSLLGTYLKNNWKVMLSCAIVGGTLIYLMVLIDQENQKRGAKK